MVCDGVCVCVDTRESAAWRVSVRSFVEETVDCVSVRVRLYVSVCAGVHVGVEQCLGARTSSHGIIAESFFGETSAQLATTVARCARACARGSECVSMFACVMKRVLCVMVFVRVRVFMCERVCVFMCERVCVWVCVCAGVCVCVDTCDSS